MHGKLPNDSDSLGKSLCVGSDQCNLCTSTMFSLTLCLVTFYSWDLVLILYFLYYWTLVGKGLFFEIETRFCLKESRNYSNT